MYTVCNGGSVSCQILTDTSSSISMQTLSDRALTSESSVGIMTLILTPSVVVFTLIYV